jgi:hypothetical protein
MGLMILAMDVLVVGWLMLVATGLVINWWLGL